MSDTTSDADSITGLTADGSKVSEITADGNVVWQRGGGGGGPIDTTPQGTPRERAENAGLTINHTEHVSSLSQVPGDDHTLYIVDGELAGDGKHALGSVNDVAICGKNNARLVVPEGHLDYSVTTTGGSGILWSGIDLDQRNDNSRGRLNFNVDDNGIIEYVEFLGHGTRTPAYEGGSPSDYSEKGWLVDAHTDKIYGGQTFHLPAKTSNGTNIIRNVDLEHGGHMEYEHKYQAGAIGVFLATSHKGTLKLQDSRYAAFPGDALYASNTTGSVECDNVIWDTNGTAGGRIANGHFKDCTAIFDYENTVLGGTSDTNNGILGLEAEAKQGVSNVDIIDCTVRLVNVVKSSAAIAARHLPSNTPGDIGTMRGNDVHVSNNADNAADLWVNSGSTVDVLEDNTFAGSATGGVSIRNEGTINSRSGNTFDYPSGRPETG